MRTLIIRRGGPAPLVLGRPARRVVAALTGVAALVAVAAAPASSSPAHHDDRSSVYVALGDSYSSGPVIPPQADPVTCLRSGDNYPGLVSRALRVRVFRDVTCSGATTADLTTAQPSNTPGGTPAPPQYDALSRTTTLVTVGIGGNDIGLISVGVGCINAGLNPTAPSCQDQFGRTYERKIDAFAATYGTVVDQIRARAPRARILLVGYPTTIRPNGCYPTQPIRPTDATYLQSLINRLDRRMRDQAVAHGAQYVNLLPSTVGHDVCAPFPTEWVEGPVPQQPAYPLHPNALGMQNAAKQVLKVVRTERDDRGDHWPDDQRRR